MSTTTQPQKTVTDDAQTDDVVLERRSWNYGYIGQDNEGRHHHLDRKLERIVVTNSKFNRDDFGAVPVYRVEGPVLHAESILLTPDGEREDELENWIAFIGSEVCGWDDRPVSAVDQVRDVISEGI